MSVCGETTIYSTAMGDVLLEREFNYLLYGILHVQIEYYEHQRHTPTQPYPLISDRFGDTPIKAVEI